MIALFMRAVRVSEGGHKQHARDARFLRREAITWHVIGQPRVRFYSSAVGSPIRWRISGENPQRFFDAGFSAEQTLEVIATVAASAITNYTASVTYPALEA